MAQARQKFATQVNADILSAVRAIAEQEGRQLQVLVEEALSDLIEKRRHGKPAHTSWTHIWPATISTNASMKN
jgi:hypothetical protein